MSKKIMIDGKLYKVVENLGYQIDANVYIKSVETDDGEKIAVKSPGKNPWRWWTVKDKIQPFGRHEG